MAGTEHIQLADLHIQIALFNDLWVSCGQRLDLGIGKRRFVHILCRTGWQFGGHDLGNEPLLGFHQLIKIGVECTLGHITEDLHLRVLVALPHDASKALLEVAGPPGTIEIMQGNKPVLDIGACAHFGRAAHEDAHLASTHFGKQLLFLLLGFGIMDKGNFLLRNTLCHELLFQVVIHIRSFCRRRNCANLLLAASDRPGNGTQTAFGNIPCGHAQGVHGLRRVEIEHLGEILRFKICIRFQTAAA